MKNNHYNLIVIGAGAGGIGTALSASRSGVKTLLIERDSIIGGTAVNAGVNTWEMGVGGTGIPHDIYSSLKQIPNGVGIYTIDHHCCWPTPGFPVYPGGNSIIDPSLDYENSLRRYGSKGIDKDEEFVRRYWHGVVFEPGAYAQVITQMLQETGCCEISTDTEFVSSRYSDHNITSCNVRKGNAEYQLTADYWVDCTADAVLCRSVGCETMYGCESFDVFKEPDAPDKSSEDINGVTLIYRVTADISKWLNEPSEITSECWWRETFPVASVMQYPCGDWNINMLPTMEGLHYANMSPDEAYLECKKRVWSHWRWMQSRWPDFMELGISWIAPRIGVREGPRVVGEYILTEHDLLAGLADQKHTDIAAIADHAIDMHSSTRGVCGELQQPYGIPFRCLVPKGWMNLYIASRGASFSHIASASCRLTRTIMKLGEAVGNTVAEKIS